MTFLPLSNDASKRDREKEKRLSGRKGRKDGVQEMSVKEKSKNLAVGRNRKKAYQGRELEKVGRKRNKGKEKNRRERERKEKEMNLPLECWYK